MDICINKVKEEDLKVYMKWYYSNMRQEAATDFFFHHLYMHFNILCIYMI